MFSCSKIEQKQLNTWVSFQSAEQPLLGQFSVSGNTVGTAVTFEFGSDAYVFVVGDAAAGIQAGDALITLTGVSSSGTVLIGGDLTFAPV